MRKGVNNKETKLPPSRKWKSKYDCKVNKGAHTLVLVKPPIYRELDRRLTVEEYYAKEDAQHDKRCKEYPNDWGCKFMGHVRYHECTACGFKITTMGEIS